MTTGERMTKFFQAIRVETESIPTQFNQWLGSLPGTNLQQLASVVAFLMTTTTVCYCFIEEVELDPITLVETYGFICAYGGIVYKQFKHKRDSYNPTLPSEQNGGTNAGPNSGRQQTGGTS